MWEAPRPLSSVALDSTDMTHLDMDGVMEVVKMWPVLFPILVPQYLQHTAHNRAPSAHSCASSATSCAPTGGYRSGVMYRVQGAGTCMCMPLLLEPAPKSTAAMLGRQPAPA
jgi:hypothetical protein